MNENSAVNIQQQEIQKLLGTDFDFPSFGISNMLDANLNQNEPIPDKDTPSESNIPSEKE
jgi:hypothetical protein